ncbi:nucleotide exchange factor GrpE [Alkalilimnicola ehrlichii]|uniref:Protein GrpE n=1 Tax=Alkalilimnicola ehrlichii TaxID=351052 RepID=A0A3E0WPU0_9GAMM|nr:nucleotide exchange factor GrpE [Alkalilimnicola ehrlichii]RFA28237.1 nucleotide exchange factor GrpE [Alkalilimnicola ehrlichii]RFA34838.1 nucleotide exchange factor GrpE [Alkalilimnicola ehrlichii]
MADNDPRSKNAAGEQEPPAAAGAPSEGAGNADELAKQLAEAEQKAEENWNNFLRARAELENVRRRSERELEQAHKYGVEKIAADLLPVKDSLEMGIAAALDEHADVEKLREGQELTLKMLEQVFERFSVEEVNPQGERFDPEKHEAMAAQESPDHEPNTVMHVVQKGYLLNDRVLRPAMVVVSKAASQGPGGQIDDKA